MSLQLKAAWEAHEFFIKEGIPYAIIGGIAVQHWGEPRFTRDVDFTILATPGKGVGELVQYIHKKRT